MVGGSELVGGSEVGKLELVGVSGRESGEGWDGSRGGRLGFVREIDGEAGPEELEPIDLVWCCRDEKGTRGV